MISADFVAACMHAFYENVRGSPIPFPTKDPTRPPPVDSDSYYEAQSYYYGLPSRPVSVYQTGAPLKRPTGPEAYCVLKEARPICDHPIADV